MAGGQGAQSLSLVRAPSSWAQRASICQGVLIVASALKSRTGSASTASASGDSVALIVAWI